jgi:hypothetical protein
MTLRLRPALATALLAVMLASAAVLAQDPSASPGPRRPDQAETGSARIRTSGAISTELVLPQVSEVFPEADGTFELQWQDVGLDTLNVSLDLAAGQLRSAFVAVGVPGTSIYDADYFADFVRTQCSVSLVRFDASAIEGTVSCNDLANADDDRTIDLEATFTATPVRPAETPAPSMPPLAPGTAQLVATGAEEATLLLPQVSVSGAVDEDGDFEVDFEDASGQLLRLSLDVEAGAVTDAFVAVGLPGSSIDDEDYYPDGWHTACEVQVLRLDASAVEGLFRCDDLTSQDGTRSIDVEGAFSALP